MLNLTTATDLGHQAWDRMGLLHNWKNDTLIWLKRRGKQDTVISVPKSDVGIRYQVDPNNVTITADTQGE